MPSNFRDLRVWSISRLLAVRVYEITESWPRDVWHLRDQTRKASGSIGANLAEGSARGNRDFARFVRIALGSANELEHWLLLARDLGLVPKSGALLDELLQIQRMLNVLHTRLRMTSRPPDTRTNN
jgi:four helix bundle protein